MNVVFPLAGMNLSGGVKNLVLQAHALQRAGHRVRLIVPDFAQAAPFPVARDVEIRALRTGPAWLPRAIRKLVYYAALATSCTVGADVCVVAYFPTAYCAVASNLLRRSRAHVLYSVAAYEPFSHGAAAQASGPSRALRAALARASYRLRARRVYASRWLRDMVGDPSGFVLGRGIDTRVFHPGARAPAAADGPVRIGVIGRAGRVKGYGDFLAALEGFEPGCPVEIRVVAVDRVPLPAGLPVRVFPPADEAGMVAFYQGCDVFVFPSLSEGFPAPPLEAMACGCAVLVTECGGVAEYARDGANCLMIPPADPPALHRALLRLCRDPELRSRLAREGVATAAAFGQARMVERLLAVMGQIAAGRAEEVRR